MRWRLRRLWCRLYSCKDSDHFPGCDRCGAALYGEGNFIDRGWLWPILRLWFAAREATWPRCWHCNRRLWMRRRIERNFCSADCYDAWIPF